MHQSADGQILDRYTDTRRSLRLQARNPIEGSDHDSDTNQTATSGTSSEARTAGSAKSKALLNSESADYILQPITSDDRRNWKGWCEVESEPAFFNVMLREFGVTGVKIQEVISLDEEILSFLPTPIYGLIFLFQFQEDDASKQESSCPDYVWFANQTTNNACASLALMNIIMNVPDLDLGPVLQQFREFSMPLTPANRGYVLSNHEFLRQVHNSFARKMDMLSADYALSNEVIESKRRAKAKKKRMKEEDGEPGFHFIAFVPIQGSVWKLDGLDRQPMNLGDFEGDWMNVARPIIEERMRRYEGDQIQFSLLSLGKSPLLSVPDQLAVNIRTLIMLDERLNKFQPDWRRFDSADESTTVLKGADVRYGVASEQLEAAVLPESTMNILDNPVTSTSELLDLRSQTVAVQVRLKANFVDELAWVEREEGQARGRRHDYTPLINTWLRMLAEKGLLQNLVSSEHSS